MAFNDPVSRRKFFKSAGLLVGAAAVPWGVTSTVNAAHSVTSPPGAAPQLEQGIQIGDVRAHRAVIWSRSDRPARVLLEYDKPSFHRSCLSSWAFRPGNQRLYRPC
jgi:alkaline phosphatase D